MILKIALKRRINIPFVAASELNALRRKVYSDYFKIISSNKNMPVGYDFVLPHNGHGNNSGTALISEKYADPGCEILIFKPHDYSDIPAVPKKRSCEIFLYLPPYMTGEEILQVSRVIAEFDGIYCDGTWALEFCEKINKPLFAGCGMNISNRIDVAECGAKYIALSKELTESEQANISCGKTFALSSGAIKVMDLIYCPFGKKCDSCDRRDYYTLTDGERRKFPLRRYKTGACRFEVYNCAYLAGKSVTGVLVDGTMQSDPEIAFEIRGDVKRQREFYKNYTRGHSDSPVF